MGTLTRANRRWEVFQPFSSDVPMLMGTDTNGDWHAYSQQPLEVITGQPMTWEILFFMVMQMDYELDYYMTRDGDSDGSVQEG